MFENVANSIVIPFSGKAGEEKDVVILKTDPGVGNSVTLRIESDRQSAGDLTVKVKSSEDNGQNYAAVSTSVVLPGGTVTWGGSVGKFFKVTAQGDGNGRIVMTASVPTQHVSQLP